MFRNALNYGFDEIMDYRSCFRNELMYTDYNVYTSDMLADCLIMLRKLNDLYQRDDYIDYNMALKISMWYDKVNSLLFDIRSYLIRECNIIPIEVLKNYKKEGK